jgi:hypothetical protein
MIKVHHVIAAILMLVLPAGNTFSQQQIRHLFSVLGGTDHPGEEGEPLKCGLPITSHALAGKFALGAEQKLALQILMTRPSMQKMRASGAFRVHYDTTGYNAPALLNAAHQRDTTSVEAYVDSVLSIAAYSFSYETETLGYAAPPSDGGLGGGPEYDIYVMELSNLYGDTTPDADVSEGGRCTSFIRVDNDFIFVTPDSNKGLPALRVTLAHELHHLIQLGSYGYWFNDVYYYEMTSTWLEDVVYTGVNDYYNYLFRSWSHFRNPQMLFASGANIIMYSRGIWGQFTAKQFGLLTMRRSWENIAANRPLPAIDLALKESGSNLPDAFAEWTAWNHFTGYRADALKYYPEGAAYPLMVENPIGLSASIRDIPDSLSPLAARYYQVPGSNDTVTIAVVNVNVAQAMAGWESTTPYTLSLTLGAHDGTYTDAGSGVYAKLKVSDLTVWRMWFIVGGNVGPGLGVRLEEGRPFPHPYVADGRSVVRIPLSVSEEAVGRLQIYSAGMDLVRTMAVRSLLVLGRQTIEWDGRVESGAVASTGVYLFVLELPDRTLTGKIALVRR